jgi:hypothetical protein
MEYITYALLDGSGVAVSSTFRSLEINNPPHGPVGAYERSVGGEGRCWKRAREKLQVEGGLFLTTSRFEQLTDTLVALP